MSHYAAELFAKERIATWHAEAGNQRLVRSQVERQASMPAVSPPGEPAPGRHPRAWLRPLRRLATRLTPAG